jgi:hypothetical protein
MTNLEKDRTNSHVCERRENIATAVLAQLVGHAGEYRPEHGEMALEAADALITTLSENTRMAKCGPYEVEVQEGEIAMSRFFPAVE